MCWFVLSCVRCVCGRDYEAEFVLASLPTVVFITEADRIQKRDFSVILMQ